ncbi:MAG: Hsp20/alpha crystallin family protein [Euryarchaeota archaeon]|nr:Hsp20/alpha crystallin family protein [Euryarchaeota archaeon]
MMPALWEELHRLEERMNQLFRELWSIPRAEERFPGFAGVRSPFCDVQETEKEVIVTAELPGVSKEDIKINATEREVEISAEVRREEEEKKEGYLRRERQFSRFYRCLSLPAEVDPSRAKATYKNGVLELRLPKVKAEKKTSIRVE